MASEKLRLEYVFLGQTLSTEQIPLEGDPKKHYHLNEEITLPYSDSYNDELLKIRVFYDTETSSTLQATLYLKISHLVEKDTPFWE